MKKFLSILATLALCLSFAVAQQEDKQAPPEKEKAAKTEKAPKEAKAPKEEKAPKAQEEKSAAKEDKAARNEQKSQAKEEEKQAKPEPGKQHSTNRPAEEAKHGEAKPAQRGGENKSSPAAKQNWDGQRFKPEYYQANYGREHTFRFSGSRWQGDRFREGSSFEFGGAWFLLGQDIPEAWDSCDTFVDEIDGVYYVECPEYPNDRFAITVIF